MILYTENTRQNRKKLIELINKFNKVSGYKIIMEKKLAMCYTLAMNHLKENF